MAETMVASLDHLMGKVSVEMMAKLKAVRMDYTKVAEKVYRMEHNLVCS